MDKKSNMSCIRDAAVAWIAGRQNELGSITMSFVNMSDSSIILAANGRLVQIVIPSSFCMVGCRSTSTASSDEVFLVTTTMGSKSDEIFENALMTLNEKLERVDIQPDALSEVLDYLFLALQKYEAVRGKKLQEGAKDESTGRFTSAGNDDDDSLSGSEESADSDDDSLDHYGYDLAACENTNSTMQLQYRCKGFLYAMAEYARLQCEFAQETSDWKEPGSTVFECSKLIQWCIVKPDPELLNVHLLIHIGGIVRDDDAASALGFFLDTPVKISLQFSKELWAQGDYKPAAHPMKLDACQVTQEVPTCWKGPTQESDEKSQLKLRFKDQTHLYGIEVLLPELIYAYFGFLVNKTITTGNKLQSQVLLSELQRFTAMGNQFLGLLCFLCVRLRALSDWCVVCWNSLPYSVCRLRTCDREFCLFRFEELGLGTPVLQEVQNTPEVVDFELSLAIVATDSTRDVFEPFPAFLLERGEIRGRSGWFSKVERVDYSVNTTQMAARLSYHQSSEYKGAESMCTNKNLDMLRAVLQSYPPIVVMKDCRDEVTLKKTLTKFWEKKLESDRQTMRGKRPEEPDGISKWTKKLWLPYDVIRFILSTSRLTLHLLKASEEFGFFNAHYQFAVLHDSPEREAYFEQRRFQQGGSFFAFHGGAAENWFSILRNGLRCLSNTPFMSCGAAYGTGIYLGAQSDISLGYCTCKGPGWSHGVLKKGFSVLAICEVINGSIRGAEAVPNSNMQGMPMMHAFPDGIMVIPPEYEKDVSIRYIIVLKGQQLYPHVPIHGTMMSESIDLKKHYRALRLAYVHRQEKQLRERREACWVHLRQQKRERPEGESEFKNHASVSRKPRSQAPLQNLFINSKTAPAASAMQAIAMEYRNIVEQIKAAREESPPSPDAEDLSILAGIEVSLPDESNFCRWHVTLSRFLFKRFPLYKDLTDCAQLWNLPEVSIKLESVFPSTYPWAPPFVRVISPRFSFHTGHVTVGGSICMELLTESGWSPVCSFESVILQIVNAMIEGGGRLDEAACISSPTEYSENEAWEAFNRVASDHGWIGRGKARF